MFPLSLARNKLKNYDYYNAKDRYKWYQDCRKHIIKKNGLLCEVGTKLHIHKDGSFSADKMQYDEKSKGYTLVTNSDLCNSSLTNKHFPIPQNSPYEHFDLPIRKPNSKPLSAEELDRLIFKIDQKEFQWKDVVK